MPDPRMRILIADDSVIERELYSVKLQQWGYDVTIAQDGLQAMDLIQTEGHSLVIADWKMPRLDGLSMCQAIRKQFTDRYVYIILVSSSSTEEYQLKGLDAGADDFMAKPLDTNELRARLHAANRRLSLQNVLIKQNGLLEDTLREVRSDLVAVSQLQHDMLPDRSLQLDDCAFDWVWRPSNFLSGDHMSLVELDDKHVAFYMLDVSGHGIPSSLRAYELARYLSLDADIGLLMTPDPAGDGLTPKAPGALALELNARFQDEGDGQNYFTLFYGLLSRADGTLRFVQAGHPSPFVVGVDGEVRNVGLGGPPIGLFPDLSYDEYTVQLQPGDRFLVVSDGLLEVRKSDDEWLDTQQVGAWLTAHRSLDLGAQMNALVRQIAAWAGTAAMIGFEDDVSVLGVEYRPVCRYEPASSPPELAAAPPPDLQSALPAAGLGPDPSALSLPPPPVVKVMVVDDSPVFARLLQSLLKSLGYEVRTVHDGMTALGLLTAWAPNVVLTDWDMPGMTGERLCSVIREMQLSFYVHLVIITGFASRDDLLKGLESGADDFLKKPVNPSELTVRINTAKRSIELHSRLKSVYAELAASEERIVKDTRAVVTMQKRQLPASGRQHVGLCIETRLPEHLRLLRDHWFVFPCGQRYTAVVWVQHVHEGIAAAVQLLALARALQEQINLAGQQVLNMHTLCEQIAALESKRPALVRVLPFRFTCTFIDRLTGQFEQCVRMSGQVHWSASAGVLSQEGAVDQMLTMQSSHNRGLEICISHDVSHVDMGRFGATVRPHRPLLSELCTGPWADSEGALTLGQCRLARGWTLPMHGNVIAVVGEYVRARAAVCALDETKAAMFDLAWAEAATNLLRHGLAQMQSDAKKPPTVQLEWFEFDHACVLCIKDHGVPIPTAVMTQAVDNMESRTDTEEVFELPESGWGLALIQQAVDRWWYGQVQGMNTLCLAQLKEAA